MPSPITTARSRSKRVKRAELTPYESEQVREIAAWKSHPPNPFAELFKCVTAAGARLVERVIPEQLAKVAIEKSYDVAEMLARPDDTRRQAGVKDLAELRNHPLEHCDRIASRVCVGSQVWAAVEGAATGAGGVLTTLIDIPLLFILSLRTIIKIGHCYGYPLDARKDRNFVLGVLIAATSGSLATRRKRLDQLHELEHFLIHETQEEIVAEEVLSLLFQLEVFEDIPAIGAISGGLLNLAFIRRVDLTARRVFQERWLRDSGKVHTIAPAAVHERQIAHGWTGALGRVAYSSSYYLGFAATFPVYIATSLLPSADNALARGLQDGAAGAQKGVDELLGWCAAIPPKSPFVPGADRYQRLPDRRTNAPASATSAETIRATKPRRSPFFGR